MRLHRDDPVPLYKQLLGEVRTRIVTGEWPVGSRLPTEAELATELRVSRVTIRQALGAAVEAGLVVRVAGKGTYVARPTNGLRSQGFVGHVVPHLSHTFNVQMLLGVESTLKAAGFQLVFCNSEGDLATEERLLAGLETEGMAGCIIQPVFGEQSDRLIRNWGEKGYPVVMLDRYLPDVDVDLVASDHFGGGYAVVKHLIDQGYTNILYLAREPIGLSSIMERLHAYQAALDDAGLVARAPFVIAGTTEHGLIQNPGVLTQREAATVDAIATMLREPNRPEAVVAMNDLHALLLIEAARQVGLTVPADLALVGFDDMDFAATLTPPLTTVTQQSFELGAAAANLLLARIRGEGSARKGARQIRLPTQLVVRSSSLNPRRAGTNCGTPSPEGTRPGGAQPVAA